MKESELRKHATCDECGKGIGASGLPLFLTVQVRRYGIDLNAVRRQDGLAAHMGSSALAMVMGTDEDMAQEMMDPVTLTICEMCAWKHPLLCLALEASRGDDDD